MPGRPLAVDDLSCIPFVSQPSISPDGTRVAFVVRTADRERDEDTSRIWLADVDGGVVRPLTAGPADSCPVWSPDGRSLAFVAARRGADGSGPPQVFVLRLDGGEAGAVTELPLGAGSPVWSPDGRTLACLAAVDIWAGEGAEDGQDEQAAARRGHAPVVVRRLDEKVDGMGLVRGLRRHLFVVPAEGGEARQLTSGDFSVGSPAWAPDGRCLVVAAAVHEDRDVDPGVSLFAVAVEDGRRTQLTDRKGTAGAPVFTPDGSAVVHVGTYGVSVELARLFSVPVDGGERTELAPDFDRNVMPGAPGYPGAAPVVVSDEVVFCARDGGLSRLYRVALGGGTPVPITDGERMVQGASVAPAVGRLAFVAATADSPGEVFVVDLGDGTERRLTSSFADALGDVALPLARPRRFTAPDGAVVEGWVLGADDVAATGPKPLLLDVHGGPHNAWAPVFDGAHLYHQRLVAEGWAVLLLNPRGSDGYGEAFLQGVSGGWGVRDEWDFLAAVDALVDEGVADPRRLAVTGYSYGGYMTCWLSARHDRFTAAVAGGVVTDNVAMFGTSDAGLLLAAEELGGNPHVDDAPFRTSSPLTYVAGVRAPTLLLHGEDDHRCPMGQAEAWFAALRSLGRPVELVRYPGADHMFLLYGRPSHRVDYCNRVADWVLHHTPPRSGERITRSSA